MAKFQFYNRYNPKPIDVGTDFNGHEETCNQQLADECEIRNIITQFEAGKISDLPAVRTPVYNDQFLNPTSYQEALNMIESVKNDFYSLPAETQRQFGDLRTYVNDMYQISQGNSEVLAKYNIANGNNQVVSSASADIDLTDASSSSSSSITRGDTEIDTST